MSDYFPWEERKTMNSRIKADCEDIWQGFINNNPVMAFLRCEDLEKDLERFDGFEKDRVEIVIRRIKYDCEDNTLAKSLEGFKELVILLSKSEPIFWYCAECEQEFKKKELVMKKINGEDFFICKKCKDKKK